MTCGECEFMDEVMMSQTEHDMCRTPPEQSARNNDTHNLSEPEGARRYGLTQSDMASGAQPIALTWVQDALPMANELRGAVCEYHAELHAL